MNTNQDNHTPSINLDDLPRFADAELQKWADDPEWSAAFDEAMQPAELAWPWLDISELCDPDCAEDHEHVTKAIPHQRKGWELHGPAGDDRWYWVPGKPSNDLVRFVAATLAGLITVQRLARETSQQRRERWQREAPVQYAVLLVVSKRLTRRLNGGRS